MKCLAFPLLAVLFTGVNVLAQQKTVTIATVNNPDMIRLKKLSPKFEEKNPDIKLNWVIVEENVLCLSTTLVRAHLQRDQSGADDVFQDSLPRASQRQYPGEHGESRPHPDSGLDQD